MVKRLSNPLKSNSFFMFGARGTGKSTLIRHLLGAEIYEINLLDEETFDRFLTDQKLLENIVKSKKTDWVFIDEIQRLPKLLNSVHKLIEETGQKFALTGSSARKLKRGSANLLAGRAFLNELYPFTYLEIQNEFNLENTLHWGSLPKVYNSVLAEDKKAYLRSYALTYIKEEIIAEQLVRNLEPFREFLTVAAQCSGTVINYSTIAREVGVQAQTVQTYFQILEETFVGFLLPHFHRSIRKSQIEAPKFYFFDNGVMKSLESSLDSAPVQGTSVYGNLFESFFIQEVFRLNRYFEKDFRLSYFRTKHGAEIDLILTKAKKTILIEIKSSQKIDQIKVNSFARLASDFGKESKAFYVSQDDNELEIENIKCQNWKTFLLGFKDL